MESKIQFTNNQNEMKEVLKIDSDGDVFWNGRKVEGDEQFKAAMIDLCGLLKKNVTRELEPLTDDEIYNSLRHLYDSDTTAKMSFDISIDEYKIIMNEMIEKNKVLGA